MAGVVALGAVLPDPDDAVGSKVTTTGDVAAVDSTAVVDSVVETTATLEVRVLNQLSEGSIPNTGSDSLDMGLFGFILMALGGVFVVSAQIVRRIH